MSFFEANGTTVGCDVRLTSLGEIQLRAPFAERYLSTTVIGNDEKFRLEVHVLSGGTGVGKIEARLYVGADLNSATPTESFGNFTDTWDTGDGTIGGWAFGAMASSGTSGLTMRADNVGFSDEGWIGSSSPGPTASGSPTDQRDTGSGTATSVDPVATASGSPTDQQDTASGTATSAASVAVASGSPTDQRDTGTGSASASVTFTATGAPTDVRDVATGTATSSVPTASGTPTDQRDTATGSATRTAPPSPPAPAPTYQPNQPFGGYQPRNTLPERRAFFDERRRGTSSADRIAVLEAKVAGQVESGTWTPVLTNVDVGDGTNQALYHWSGGSEAAEVGTLEIHGRLVLGAGSSVSGTPLLSLPPGFVYDIIAKTSNQVWSGSVKFSSGGIGGHVGQVRWGTGNTFSLVGIEIGGISTPVIFAITATWPFTWASGSTFYYALTVPAARVAVPTASGTPTDRRDTAAGSATRTVPAASTASGTPTDQQDTATGSAAAGPTPTAGFGIDLFGDDPFGGS